jgi:hypothetical protein
MPAHLMCMDIGIFGIAPPNFKTQAEIADIIKVNRPDFRSYRSLVRQVPAWILGQRSTRPRPRRGQYAC